MIALSYCRPVAAASILLTASLFVLATAQEAAAADAKGDLWETTSQMSMEGLPMQMPVTTLKVCAAKGSKQPPGGPDRQNCRNSDMKTVGPKVTWTVKCSGPEMSGVGEITYSGADSYTGSIRFKSADGNMTVKLAGRKVGGCDNPQ